MKSKGVVRMNLGNVMIFGDSYSTFEGYIPENYAIYYSKDADYTDVHSVEDTWWYRLITETDSILITNDSWSGSTICHTGYNNSDCSKTSSFIYRLNKYISEGFFEKNKVDTVFVFGGTNDSWAGVPIGELKYSDWKDEELFSFLPAISFLLNKLKETLPETRIACLINTELSSAIANGIADACEHYGTEYIKFSKIDKTNGHPTVKGMEQIKDEILKALS